MDSLSEFLPLLFIVAYYLLAGRRKAAERKRQAQRETAPQEPLVAEEAPSAPTPFQSFLTQLEDAVAEANGVAAPSAETAPPVPMPKTARPEARRKVEPRPAPPARLLPRRVESEFHALGGSFDAQSPVDHERHGFGPENPLSEESFEHRPAGAPRRQSRAYDPHGLVKKASPAPPPSDWRHRLDDPATARDAFVLQTLFGPRGGRRADRR